MDDLWHQRRKIKQQALEKAITDLMEFLRNPDKLRFKAGEWEVDIKRCAVQGRKQDEQL